MDNPAAESNSHASVKSDAKPSNVTPRWVKVFGTILIIVILLFIILLLTGGPHGPNRHLRPGSGDPQTSSWGA